MSQFQPRKYSVVILSARGQVVRVLGRSFSISMAAAILRSACRAPDPDGVPAIMASDQPISRAICRARS